MRTIIFLWPGAVPYMINIYEQLANWGYHVIVYNTESDKTTPCDTPQHDNVEYRDAINISYEELLEQTIKESPILIVTSGWYKKKYKKVCHYFKNKLGIPTICKIDSQFLYTWRQRIGFLVSPWFIKPSFSYMLVPGVRQYHFARRLGYKRQNILLYGLSADTKLFNSCNIETKKNHYPKTFLFASRLQKEKGLGLLIKAWDEIKDKNGWNVVIIGTGPEKERLHLDSIDGVTTYEYMQQNELMKFAEKSGIYVLPSVQEPWALTIHEFSAAGMPMICSETCGATPHFLINGYNGYTFETGNYQSLKKRMEKVMAMSDKELFEMSERSRKLSTQITAEFSAASILSVLN